MKRNQNTRQNLVTKTCGAASTSYNTSSLSQCDYMFKSLCQKSLLLAILPGAIH